MAEIKRLPEDVAKQIYATSSITSLNFVVLGLLENALDARSSRISIKVDYARASCWVEDDGNGICTADFEEDGGLGKPFRTSNISGNEDRLGSNGLFLSSLAAISTLSITSRQRMSPSTNSLILHQSHPATRLLPAPDYMALDLGEHGTKVSIHDLFGSMAVRVKQRPVSHERRAVRDKEWYRLRNAITGILLAHSQALLITVRGCDDGHRLRINTSNVMNGSIPPPDEAKFNSKLMISILRQAFSFDTASGWVQTSARTTRFTARAIVCLEPSAARTKQFIALGHRYMPPGEIFEALYESINRLCWNSSFGAVENSLERWPMFVMKIDGHARFEGRTHRQEFMTAVMETVTAMMTGFLQEHLFLTKTSRRPKTLQVSKSHDTANPVNEKAGTVHGKLDLELKSSILRSFSNLDFQVNYPSADNEQQKSLVTDDSNFRSRFLSSRSVTKIASKNEARKLLPLRKADKGCNTPNVGKETLTYQVIPQEEDAASGSVLNVPQQGAMQKKPISVILDENEYVDWIDPYSKRLFRLNTRTGWMHGPGYPERLSTVNNTKAQVAMMRKTTVILPRLTRSAHGLAPLKEGSWVQKALLDWKNPVFELTEQPIQNHEIDSIEHLPASLCQSNVHGAAESADISMARSDLKLSRYALRNAEIIAQVDSKFILIKIGASDSRNASDMIVLVDQHASDERVKVEALMQDLCSVPDSSVRNFVSPLGHKSGVDTILLQDFINFELSYQEYNLLLRSAQYFAKWGILYDLKVSDNARSGLESRKSCRLAVLSLPDSIAQRCKVEPAVLIKILRTEAWREEESHETKKPPASTDAKDWTKKIHHCPEGILNLLNSRACRSAVMFNDLLTLSQCKELIRSLSGCQFPFQCAHGRPSMVPILDLGHNEAGNSIRYDVGEHDNFRSAWDSWI